VSSVVDTAAQSAAPDPATRIDRPHGRPVVDSGAALELVGSLLASVAAVWLVFTVAGLSAPFGLGLCSLIGFVVLYGVVEWRLHGILHAKDRLATLYVWLGAGIAFVPLAAIIIYVLVKGLPVLASHFPHFLTGDMSKAGPAEPVTAAGMSAAIVGTLEQVGLATLFSVPIAVFTATYLNEIRGWFSLVVRTVVDSMTGTPSIIAGLFIYLLWVYPRHTNGPSGFAASLALTIMMLPIVTRSAEEVLRIVPGSLREAALALGSPQWRMILRVVLPTARAGLVTAVILGIARAVG
jgi:phosphate transport system permease protein